MQSNSTLSQPIGALLRRAPRLELTDSLARAASLVRDSAFGFVPVVKDGFLAGVVTERSLAASLSTGSSPSDSVEIALRPAPPALPAYLTGAEALRRLEELEVPELPVVDIDNRLVGIVGASDLFPRVDGPPPLPMIGGMATPFGVYLTAGGVRGGAGPLALAATGMLLSTVYLVASLGGIFALDALADWLRLEAFPEWVYGVLPFALFMAAIRLMPLSGTHAAEHMTVHAMEWGESLDLEVVKRMPRVHPRCGTNLAVALSLFLTLAEWRWTDESQLRLLVAVFATLMVWRPLGHFVQYWITTKPPTDEQVMTGIHAGQDLIRNFQRQGRSKIDFLSRLGASGIFHVMAGSFLMILIAELVARLLGESLGLF